MNKWVWLLIGAAVLILGGAGMAFAVKPGAVLSDNPAIVRAREILARIWQSFGYPLTVTSGLDGTHSAQSYHYLGLADDYRTHDVDRNALQQMVAQAKVELGPDYRVLLEDLNGSNEHLHVEYRGG